MENKKYEEKILSFWELLCEHNIEIPMIQRDYAQGRIVNLNILQNFLEALKDSIIEDSEIRLDFIYGNIVNDVFQPLDGQQRLTTLFLLYWYAAEKDGKLNQDNKNILSKFVYETRFTSRDFCDVLVKQSVSIYSYDEKVSQEIIDTNWFFLSWKKDPTIQSMLNSIDVIHSNFYGIEDLWEKLSTKKLISFYYVELENIGLSDDLYIKMNARGKLLTHFETFKAELQKLSSDNGWDNNVSFNERFSFKIDTKWTDFLWMKYKKNNCVDTAHMRFITAVIMNRIALSKIEDRLTLIQLLNDQSSELKASYFTKGFYEYLYVCYEIYANFKGYDEKLKLDFPLWRHQPQNSILSNIVYDDQRDNTYTIKVLFFAQTEYLRRIPKFDKNSFIEWMRVIRNIISKGDVDKDGKRPDIIRSPQAFYGVVNLIDELAEGCGDIYNFLNTNVIKSTFAKEQVDEERVKAKLINYCPKLKELIWKAEDNELLRGRINFILYCIDYDNIPDHFNVELFAQVTKVFEIYFNKESDITADFRKAMLSLEVNGQYEFYNYWWSRWGVINSTKRKLFDKYRELEYYIYSEQKEYLKKLILLLTFKSLKQIINDFEPPTDMPRWKVRLIKEDILNTKLVKSNYIAIPDDNTCCYLLKSKRPRDMEGCIKIE